MAITQERVKAWKYLESQIALIRDPILKNSIFSEYKQRALKEWGYFPKTGQIVKQKIELDNWEKEFVEDIKKAEIYEVDTRIKKREQTKKEAKARMKDFISKGGNLKDIPDDVRSNTIEKLYYECLLEYGDEIMEEADRFIKK